jgi:hypothetical protein
MHSASTALCVLVALAAGGGIGAAQNVATGQYSVEAKLITLPDAEASDLHQDGAVADADLASIEQRPDAQTKAFPTVSALMGQKASTSLTQPMGMPDGSSRDVGPALDVNALADGRFHIAFHSFELLGYKEPAAIHPHFRSHGVSRNIQPNTAEGPAFALIDVTPHSDPPVLYDASGRQQASAADSHQLRLLFVKITRG